MTRDEYDDIPLGAAISAIEPDPKDPNLRHIRVDGRVCARVRKADVERLSIEVGQPWDKRRAGEIQIARHVVKARKTAMNMLGRRSFSRGELGERLRRRGFEPETAAIVVDELTEEGWINDREFAESVVRTMLVAKPAGARLLTQKLMSKRIDRALAEQVSREALAEVDLVESALQLARKRISTMKALPAETVRRRIAAALARRGFEPDVVHSALSSLALDFDENAPSD